MGIVAGIYFLLVALILGVTIIKLAKVKLGWLLELAGGWLIGIILLTQIIFWQSWLVPFSGQAIIVSSMVIGLICGWLWWKKRWKIKIDKVEKDELWRLLVFFGFWAVLMGVIWSRMLVRETDGLYAGWVNIWGDWAAHLSYMGSFGWGDNFPAEMPILAGYKFSYPFLSDFSAAILVRLGMDMVKAMVWPSWLLSMILVVGLYELGKMIWGKVKAGLLTVLLFLFNGGLGFWWWFKDVKEMGWSEVIKNLPREYTHLEKLANIEWINVITSQVVPQRGFLLGFPLVVLIYILVWQYWSNRRKVKELWLAGWLAVLLPLVHAHSFVMIGFVSGVLALTELVKAKKKDRVKILKIWSRFFAPIVVLGLSQWLGFYGQAVSQAGFVQFRPGWLADRDGKFWWLFWVKNLGVMLGLVIIGMRLAKQKLRWFSLGFWLVFLMANIWLFQPWEWDNTKFIVHWYLIASVLGAGVIEKGLEDKRRRIKGLVIGGLGLAILAGGLDVWRLTQYEFRKIRFWDNQALELADWVRKETDKKAVFLTAGNHDHWLPCLTGRKIVMGFSGWLWTYGIDYQDQETAARQMFLGEEGTEDLLKAYGVDYVLVGPLEKAQGINEEYYKTKHELVYELGTTAIFKI